MPSQRTTQKARRDLREGKRPTTAAGEFVREEMRHVRQGKHGARSPKQAIAIGLSKARRAGIGVKPPEKGRTSERTRRSAERDYEIGQGKRKPRRPSPRRSRAVRAALTREPRKTASRPALRRQAKEAAAERKRRATAGGARSKSKRAKGRAAPPRASSRQSSPPRASSRQSSPPRASSRQSSPPRSRAKNGRTRSSKSGRRTSRAKPRRRRAAA